MLVCIAQNALCITQNALYQLNIRFRSALIFTAHDDCKYLQLGVLFQKKNVTKLAVKIK